MFAPETVWRWKGVRKKKWRRTIARAENLNLKKKCKLFHCERKRFGRQKKILCIKMESMENRHEKTRMRLKNILNASKLEHVEQNKTKKENVFPFSWKSFCFMPRVHTHTYTHDNHFNFKYWPKWSISLKWSGYFSEFK